MSELARFVERGYQERSLWSEEGWEWRARGAIDRPRFWGEPNWRAYLEPNQPVVGVSWFEAEAYAQFAGARLPSEAEWERAARGADGRLFPWGEEWIAANAAHRGGPRHTLPVGCFPAGKSPHGLFDASGNVWEWTRDRYAAGSEQEEPASPATGGARRAQHQRTARGGAWNAHPPQLRCASRNGWPREARFSNIGFRLAR